MLKYFLRRLAILIPTLLGVTIVVFGIINLAPGSPVEQKLQQMRFGGGAGPSGDSGSRGGTHGISNEIQAPINKQYGFDKPIHHHYLWRINIIATILLEECTT